jgi:hypothetical protein
MSYFELLEQFWQLDTERTIAPLASKLYFYLLNQFNGATPRWPAKISRRANQVYADLNVDKKSLATAVAVLEERGLVAYVGGSKTAASIWWLNYESVVGKYSPQERPDWSNMKGNNSPSSATKTPDWSEMEGNISPQKTSVYKERARFSEQIVEENKTKGVGEAAEEITLAPLPAQEKVVSPPVAEPPTKIGAAELPEALAAEAKALANEIGQAWFISEIKNQPKWARIHSFVRRLASLGRIEEVRRYFAGYQVAHLRPGVRPHQLDKWLGSPADDYAQGEWKGCEWPDMAAKAQNSPSYGPIVSQATVGTTSSPTKARQAKSW